MAYPIRLIDQHFGLCISSNDILMPLTYNNNKSYYTRPWVSYNVAQEFDTFIENDYCQFKIVLDVQQFQVKDLNVRVSEKYIKIEGKHVEKEDDHGFISRQLKRRYALPKGCSAERVTSCLSSDGVLTVLAPKTIITQEKVVSIKTCDGKLNDNNIKSKIAENISTAMKIKDTEDKKNVCTFSMDDQKLTKNILFGDTTESSLVFDSFNIKETKSNKDKNEIVLKDHSPLFKPELFTSICTNISEKTSDCSDIVQCSQNIESEDSKLVLESKEESFVQASSLAEANLKSECIASMYENKNISTSVNEKSNLAKSLEISQSTNIESNEVMEKSKAQYSSATDSIYNKNTHKMLEESNKYISSASIAETIETATQSSKSETSNSKSVLYETLESQEASSSSFKTVCMNEITDNMSEWVSDITAELMEAAENNNN